MFATGHLGRKYWFMPPSYWSGKKYLGQEVLPEDFWQKVANNLTQKAEIQELLRSHIDNVVQGLICCTVWGETVASIVGG